MLMTYRRPTKIRAWRRHRGLTLRQLAARINDGRDAPLISYASLGRIERGIQPYSQDTLEAIAAALATEPAVLLYDDNPGATEHQLMAIYGWASPKQAALYTRRANRRKLAGDAMHLIRLQRAPSVPPAGAEKSRWDESDEKANDRNALPAGMVPRGGVKE